MKIRSKLILMVSIWEILLTWVITRTLDSFVRFLRQRIRLKVDARLLHGFYAHVIDQCFAQYVADKEFFEVITQLQLFRAYVLLVFGIHKRMHSEGVLETKSCRSCKIITENKDFFRKYVSDFKLYPPFKFSKK